MGQAAYRRVAVAPRLTGATEAVAVEADERDVDVRVVVAIRVEVAINDLLADVPPVVEALHTELKLLVSAHPIHPHGHTHNDVPDVN